MKFKDNRLSRVLRRLLGEEKGQAMMEGRGYVTPNDVKTVAPDILRHRVIVTYEAEAEEKSSEEIVRTVLNEIKVP